MARTSCTIHFGLIDTTMKTDSTIAVSEHAAFCAPDDLKLNFLRTAKYATLEPDAWRADGTFVTMPDTTTSSIGLWSAVQSGADGSFDAPVVLTITFGSLHTTKGVTLDMSPYADYANSVNIKWYNGANLLSDITFTPNANEYLCENLVTGYNKLVLTFNSMTGPYRYLKLKRIIYGEEITFGTESLVSASVLEECNPISSEITINTLNFTLQNNNADFSILNPQGVYAALQQLQPISVTETIDGVERDMGTFYLTEWENETETKIRMHGVDLIGTMDMTMFKGGIYSGATAGSIISAIMTSANVPYALDSSLTNVLIDGWIPYCSHREALQQVCFALGAMVDTSRDVLVNIKPAPVSSSSHITLAQKFSGGKVTLLPLVTGVELLEHKFVAINDAVTLYTGTLSAGTYTVYFEEPAHTLTVSGAVIASSGANHAVLTVSTTGTVTLDGKKYSDTTVIVGKYNPDLVATDKTNVLSVDTAYLISGRNSASIVDKVYNYYQGRLKQEFSITPTNDRVGTIVDIDTIYETTKAATIESLEIDLVGGFTQRVVAVGA